MRNGGPLISVVTGSVEYSQLTHLGTTPVKRKLIRINLHSQEKERYMAWHGMVLPKGPLYAHLWQGGFEYATKSLPSTSAPVLQGLYNKPSGAGSTSDISTDSFALSPYAEGEYLSFMQIFSPPYSCFSACL